MKNTASEAPPADALQPPGFRLVRYHSPMLLGHIAVGLAGRRLTPGVSLGA
ncbi:MAG: hypothetical protein H0T05_04810 [Acidobacteria bacterium]|nr:hypothetical protein [Acidobacteriota bacterium]